RSVRDQQRSVVVSVWKKTIASRRRRSAIGVDRQANGIGWADVRWPAVRHCEVQGESSNRGFLGDMVWAVPGVVAGFEGCVREISRQGFGSGGRGFGQRAFGPNGFFGQREIALGEYRGGGKGWEAAISTGR